MNRQILDEVIKRAESLSKSMAALVPYNMLKGDMLGMDNIAWKVKEANRDVEYVAITNTANKILVHTDVQKIGRFLLQAGSNDIIKQMREGIRLYEIKDAPGYFEFHTPIFFKNKQLGNIVIGMDKSVLLETASETRKKILAGSGILILLGAGCIIVLSSWLTGPINELAKGVDQLKTGKIAKLHISSHDEIGKLTASFNRMTEVTARQQAKLTNYAQELENAYVSTVKVLAAAIDARDPYTLGHSTRVAKLSQKIGEAIGLSRQELDDLEIASLFHDVGKLKTPDYVLLKEGPLDALEHREITSHSDYGAAILSRAPSLQKYIPAVRHHHEWFNGEGYPDGLRGDEIPLHAAIIAIADAFDAMTSVRPYKSSFSREEALVELTRFSGKQFNPWLVEVFETALNSSAMAAKQFSIRD